MATKTLPQVRPARKSQQQQPEVPRPILSTEQVEALKKFSDQANEFWNDVLDARSVLCFLVRVTWIESCGDDDDQEHSAMPEDLNHLCTYGQSLSETLRMVALKIQERATKFDYAQINFHRLLDSFGPQASKSEAPER